MIPCPVALRRRVGFPVRLRGRRGRSYHGRRPRDVSARSLMAEAAPAALTESLFPQDAQVLEQRGDPADPRLAGLRRASPPAWPCCGSGSCRRGGATRRSSPALSDRHRRRTSSSTLRGSDRLGRVAYLPAMMMPNRHDDPLPARGGGALPVRPDPRLPHHDRERTVNYRLFGADEVRAYCTVEGVLIDVRSGTIPFSSIVTDRFEAKKSEQRQGLRGDGGAGDAEGDRPGVGEDWRQDTAAYLKDAPAAHAGRGGCRALQTIGATPPPVEVSSRHQVGGLS